ncbi:hypothetical protein SAMN02927903_03023 [Flavobacterium caeni]|uniref:Uncharacterized protein n=1 Tax=Flavobacterium caeni TaxID=490189 RepID=A0A1G5K1B9_9FLAO|nr:hypothetical protein SAMN02927903_03023 [Flavobacterium caeni]
MFSNPEDLIDFDYKLLKKLKAEWDIEEADRKKVQALEELKKLS